MYISQSFVACVFVGLYSYSLLSAAMCFIQFVERWNVIPGRQSFPESVCALRPILDRLLGTLRRKSSFFPLARSFDSCSVIPYLRSFWESGPRVCRRLRVCTLSLLEVGDFQASNNSNGAAL